MTYLEESNRQYWEWLEGGLRLAAVGAVGLWGVGLVWSRRSRGNRRQQGAAR